MITNNAQNGNGEGADPHNPALEQESASANAFLIRPAKGALKGLKAIKSQIKAEGCRWHSG